DREIQPCGIIGDTAESPHAKQRKRSLVYVGIPGTDWEIGVFRRQLLPKNREYNRLDPSHSSSNHGVSFSDNARRLCNDVKAGNVFGLTAEISGVPVTPFNGCGSRTL